VLAGAKIIAEMFGENMDCNSQTQHPSFIRDAWEDIKSKSASNREHGAMRESDDSRGSKALANYFRTLLHEWI